MNDPVPRDEASIMQWDRFAAMSPIQRLSLGLRWSAFALKLRRERIQRTFPFADTVGLRWAMTREVFGYPPGTDPIP